MRIPRIGLPLLTVIWLLALWCVSSPAGAVCAPATEHGTWRNHDRYANGVLRVEIEMHCQDLVVNGEPWPPGYPWYVKVFERCGAGECAWGEAGGVTIDSRFIMAAFDRGNAETRVYLRMDPISRDMLYGYVYRHFRDRPEANYGEHYWFVGKRTQPCTVDMTRKEWADSLAGWLDCMDGVAANGPAAPVPAE